MYNHVDKLGEPTRADVLGALGEKFAEFALHWSRIVRSVFLHIVVIKVLNYEPRGLPRRATADLDTDSLFGESPPAPPARAFSSSSSFGRRTASPAPSPALGARAASPPARSRIPGSGSFDGARGHPGSTSHDSTSSWGRMPKPDSEQAIAKAMREIERYAALRGQFEEAIAQLRALAAAPAVKREDTEDADAGRGVRRRRSGDNRKRSLRNRVFGSSSSSGLSIGHRRTDSPGVSEPLTAVEGGSSVGSSGSGRNVDVESLLPTADGRPVVVRREYARYAVEELDQLLAKWGDVREMMERYDALTKPGRANAATPPPRGRSRELVLSMNVISDDTDDDDDDDGDAHRIDEW